MAFAYLVARSDISNTKVSVTSVTQLAIVAVAQLILVLPVILVCFYQVSLDYAQNNVQRELSNLKILNLDFAKSVTQVAILVNKMLSSAHHVLGNKSAAKTYS